MLAKMFVTTQLQLQLQASVTYKKALSNNSDTNMPGGFDFKAYQEKNTTLKLLCIDKNTDAAMFAIEIDKFSIEF